MRAVPADVNASWRPRGRGPGVWVHDQMVCAIVTPVEKVTGIGGLFFRAKDPEMLRKWYDEHLGVTPGPRDYGQLPWSQEAGPTVFEPFPANTDYFGSPERAWMINFRVRDLDAMVAQLRAAGLEVKVDDQIYPNGRFAKLRDPEGNPIELWEPKD